MRKCLLLSQMFFGTRAYVSDIRCQFVSKFSTFARETRPLILNFFAGLLVPLGLEKESLQKSETREKQAEKCVCRFASRLFFLTKRGKAREEFLNNASEKEHGFSLKRLSGPQAAFPGAILLQIKDTHTHARNSHHLCNQSIAKINLYLTDLLKKYSCTV